MTGAMTGAMTGGVLQAATADGALAWAGVEVAAAVDLTRLTGYAHLPEADRVAQAYRADAGYLARQCQLAGAVLDHRWLAGPDGLARAVLARVGARTGPEAVAAAATVRDLLADVPDHVSAGPVTDPDRLHELLDPFEPDPAGVAEISRVPLTGTPGRPDAHTGRYLAVLPFGWHPERWDAALRALAAQPGRSVLSVGLQAWQPPQEMIRGLEAEAQAYHRLAQPAARRGTGLVGTSWLPPEPFAQLAAPLYAAAASRYRGPVFRVRVTLASSRPLDPGLVGAVLAAVAADDPAAVRADRPDGAALATAVRLLRGLGVPPPSTDAARLLVTLADPAEAAACCRLPAAAGGRWYGLPVSQPAPHRQAGLHVAGDYVQGNKTGGDTLVRGDKHVHLGHGPG